ncbi:hypothetical protein [Rhodococcoides kyotonense]|uniref:Uncharacterized protein n=1 Tax=Rhodococcoides kyotonense TaxID=398843 RepID=A0A239L353_9NOCA|nr:hypothetical protein [Rhodococcus kyotonensis]SNT25027.1 hypothetical protein SAMN05421642_11213 [Rhodococcus kyotonensis]
MISLPVAVTIASVCVGFVLFVSAAAGAQQKWNRRRVIALLVAAICCLSVVPLTVALAAAV